MIVKEKLYTAQKYLQEERKRLREEGKYEFLEGKLVEMAGASRIHNQITSNIHILLGTSLDLDKFDIYQSDLRVISGDQKGYFYPDVVVNGQPAHFLDEEFDTLLNPLVLVEVLSPTTKGFDRGEKFRSYRSIKSLQEYILVNPERALVEIYFRTGAETWAFTEYASLTQNINLQSLKVELSMQAIYRKTPLARKPKS